MFCFVLGGGDGVVGVVTGSVFRALSWVDTWDWGVVVGLISDVGGVFSCVLGSIGEVRDVGAGLTGWGVVLRAVSVTGDEDGRILGATLWDVEIFGVVVTFWAKILFYKENLIKNSQVRSVNLFDTYKFWTD